MKIIFHVGAGKTGTSSIQGTLKNSEDLLYDKGIKYFGLMLEYAPVKIYEWQEAAANKEFLNLSDEDACNQVFDVITQNIAFLKESDIHTIIWSNEWFMGRHNTVISPMKMLEESGHEVKIIAYVRRHDAWAKSAYNQWGIKHKTYKGKLIPFREYIEKRPVKFSGSISAWADSFGENFYLRNFDSVTDVVDDFCEATEIDKKFIRKKRTNESPGPEELMMRALFNNSRANDVMPVVFERLFQTIKIDFKKNPVDWMRDLLPSDADLEELANRSESDLRKINYLLEERNQPMLSFEYNKENKEYNINHDIAYSVLFQLLERQAVQLQQLRKEVMLIKKSI